MPLTDTLIRTRKPAASPRKISDGGGLHVLFTPQGSRLWRLAYRFGGKQKLLALGSYPSVTLAEARARRDEAKRLIATGVDPSERAKQAKAEARAASANTFAILADEFLDKVEREGKAEATLKKTRWLVGLALPDLAPFHPKCVIFLKSFIFKALNRLDCHTHCDTIEEWTT